MTARKRSSNEDFNGKKAINLGAPTAASNDAARKVDIEAVQTFSVSRANHTGTQLANTVSDFDTQVRTNRLDQMAAPTAPVGLNSQRLTSVLDPTSAQDGATKAYVDAQLAGVVSGTVTKGSVRVAAAANVNIASPGTTIDGITMAVNDIVLLTAQTTPSQEGPYTYNGSATAMTRATNWDTNAEAVLGSQWIVREGTQADKFALMTNDTAITLGTTDPAFIFIGIAPAGVAPIEQTMGDGSATSFTITHNFNTRAVLVTVYRTASPFDEVDVYVERATVNTVVVAPDEVWSSAQFTAVVSKA